MNKSLTRLIEAAGAVQAMIWHGDLTVSDKPILTQEEIADILKEFDSALAVYDS